MAIGDVLREMLVKVRYEYDETSEQRMRTGLRRSVVEANLLTDAIKAFVRTTLDAFPKLITGFSNLYFTMNRTGSSVSGLKALQFAATQTGASVEEASAAVEALGKSMRSLPGMKSYWESQIPALKGVEDNAKRVVEIGKFLKGLNNRPLAEAYNKELLHWSDNFLQGVMSGDFEKAYNERLDVMRKFGLEEEKSASLAKQMTENWRKFMLVATTGFEKLALDLFPVLNKQLEKFTLYLIEHEGDIVRWVGDLEEGLVKAGHFIRDDVYPAVAKMASYVRDVLVPAVTSVKDAFGGWGEAFDAAWKIMFPKLALLKGFVDTYQIFKGLPDGPSEPGAAKDWGEALVKIEENTGAIKSILDAIKLLWTEALKPVLDDIGSAFGKIPQFFGSALGFGSPKPGGAGAQSGGTPGGAQEGNPSGGSARPEAREKMMGWAMDQLRKEGVPEENLRAAAANLVGQADMESGLVPTKSHDGGTGYGIYGARLDRRSKMFSWLRANNYELSSAEGQMRYMAHEAMSGSYPRTRQILMSGQIGRGTTNTITGEFERPAVINDRYGAVLQAHRAHSAPERQTSEVPPPPARPRDRHSARELPRQFAFLAQPLQDGNKSWVHHANVTLRSSNTFNIQAGGPGTEMKVAAAVSRQNERDMAAARRAVSTDWVHNTIMRA
jgi:hypothetical protein